MELSQESGIQDQTNDYRTIEQTMEKLPDGARRLAAQLTTPAGFDSLWKVLTDYDRLNLFIPNLLTSKIIYENNNNIHLKQIGSQDFLGLKFSAEVILDLYEEKDIGKLIKSYKLKAKKFINIETEVAKQISKGKLIGWFQGSMEFGQRALGNRSIVCSAKLSKTVDIYC